MASASPQWMPLENMVPATKYSGIKHLQSAIFEGDVIEACRLVRQLAQQQAEIQLIPRFPPPKAEISVKVCLEDKNKSQGDLVLRLSPNITVSELKDKMLYERGIPPELQCWVIRNEIMRDDRKTLMSCGIEHDGAMVHLYVLSARLSCSSNNFRKKYEHIWDGAQSKSDSSEVSQIPAPAPRPAPTSLPPPRISFLPPAAATESVATASVYTAPPPTQSLNLGATAELPKPPAAGWACPVCTFINVPSRPGCEMCSETRPAGYKMPESFEIPSHEQARLAREAEEQATMRRGHLEEDDRDQIIAALREPLPLSSLPTATREAARGFNSTQMGTAAAIPSTAEMSWECQRCTFVNAAVRPGCEICSAARPDVGIELGAPIDDIDRVQLASFKHALLNYMLDNEADNDDANQPDDSQA